MYKFGIEVCHKKQLAPYGVMKDFKLATTLDPGLVPE